jgi:hypothetical protein
MCDRRSMELVSFAADVGHHVDRFDSDFVLSPVMGPRDSARTVVMHLAAGGAVGEHDAVATQLFCVVEGRGWVSGADGVRRPIEKHQAAQWTVGEVHAAGTDVGLVAIVIEGSFTVPAPRVVA